MMLTPNEDLYERSSYSKYLSKYIIKTALWMHPSSAKTPCHIGLLLLLPAHISCYEQLNSIDFIWLFADRPALQFLAVASHRPAERLKRCLLSSSTILLQNLSCLKSIPPPSNDSLKMNAQKIDPPRSRLCHTNKSERLRFLFWNLFVHQHKRLKKYLLRFPLYFLHCH